MLKIGCSGNLQQEIQNHWEPRHTVHNRLWRIKARPQIEITFMFCSLAWLDEAKNQEGALLREFEDEFWDLPILNAQRGYARGNDRHYRS